MGVKQLQYAQELEARLKKGKSLDTAHKSAGKAASVKKEKPKLNWAQKLKVKVGMTLAKEKRRRARNEARFPKKKKDTDRTKSVKGQLKRSGLTDREIRKLQGK